MGKRSGKRKEPEVETTPAPEPFRPSTYAMVDSSIMIVLMIITAVVLNVVVYNTGDTDASASDLTRTDTVTLDPQWEPERVGAMLLTSTIPMASYVDAIGRDYYYPDQSVDTLIVEDVKVRQGQGGAYSENGLIIGLEEPIREQLNAILPTGVAYILNITYTSTNGADTSDPETVYITGRGNDMMTLSETWARFNEGSSTTSSAIFDLGDNLGGGVPGSGTQYGDVTLSITVRLSIYEITAANDRGWS